MPEMTWTPYEEYDTINQTTTIPESCGCAVIGLITVRDCKGNIEGLLTPNDASIYHVNTIETPIGYVKVFDPVTGGFLGILSVADAEEYLTFLNNLTQP
jgi:hypothetical protein